MKANPHFKDKLYSRVYDYSRKSMSFKKKFKDLVIKLLFNVLLGILIYLSINLFNNNQTRIFLSLSIAGAIIINFLLDLALENNEIKKLKKQEKTYASTFILLNDDYKLSQKNIKARDEFLSIISHELKTPLTIMLLKLHNELNNIQNASLANFSVKELMEVLKNSEKQIEWLKSVTNDLLDASLITTGKMNLLLADTDLINITKQVTQSFSEFTKKEKYKITINAPSPVVGKWDKIRIEQVITNLFSNAIKYGNGKPIDIEISKNNDHAKFVIKDNGMGITKGEQDVIFELFKRAKQEGDRKKGLGVGLFISSQIVKIHGGKIKVSSSPDKGATFTVELPLKKS